MTLPRVLGTDNVLLDGLLFSLAVMTFLGAHEMGHYLTCRRYGIDATLPYFLPFPTLFGTIGAFIKIKSPITSRKALFDVGIAGPLAGFTVMIPWMYLGIKWSHIEPAVQSPSKMYLGEPLISDILISISGMNIPDGFELNVHPVFLAAWFGAIATAINLIPVGQLDGGHIIYSIFTRKSKAIYNFAFLITVATAAGAYIFADYPGWILWVVIVFVLMRKGHPPTLNDFSGIGLSRYILAVIALIIFILTFMPVPIHVVDLI